MNIKTNNRMEQKLLSICFPTYNRAKCIGEQLKRLSTVDKSVLKEVEIIVSDNCSPDDTQEVVELYQALLDFRYNRNERNLGPDENYLYCFSHATGKYIWLVGDDDYLIPSNLYVVIETLKDKDYGFLYIKPGVKQERPQCVEYTSKADFLKEIDINITFLTSSIIRRDYIGEVDVAPYKGTWQEYVPFFLTSLLKGEVNGELQYNIYEDPAAADTNGGYKIFNVFGTGFMKIINDYYDQGLISKNIYAIEKEASFKFLMPFAYRLIVERQSSNFITDEAWPTLNKLFGRWKVKKALLKIYFKKILIYFRAIILEK